VTRNQCLLRYGRYSCDLYNRCSTWFLCISTQLSALRLTEVHTLSKIPASTRISWDTFSVRFCNTSKSLIDAKHTEVIRCPHNQESSGLRSGDRAGHLTAFASYPLFTYNLVEAQSDRINLRGLVRKRTIPTVRSPYIGEVCAKFCG
jgi:hypothetical protein